MLEEDQIDEMAEEFKIFKLEKMVLPMPSILGSEWCAKLGAVDMIHYELALQERQLNVFYVDEASSTGHVAAATITAATPAATTATSDPSTTTIPTTTAVSTTTPTTATTATATATMQVPMPGSQTVLMLKKELAVLQTIVASLVERVGASEQLLQEAHWHLAEQKANVKLLTDQVAALQQEVNPTAAESLAVEALPVVMRTDAAETLAAATAQPEDDLLTTITAPQEDEMLAAATADVPTQQDESLVVVTAMNVDESPIGKFHHK
ncbi:hypothetical protein BDR04DRAFT_1154185 [Suillus decipiens]|nr:hypothetical protein BDR04DRAFT_1154185 [Suillus decipiens]